jgi:hypothetical protein
MSRVMRIPNDVVAAAVPALRVMLLWPIAIAWRRIYQGVLIRFGYTRAIGAITLARLFTVLAGLGAGSLLGIQQGALVAAVAMAASTLVETLLTVLWATRVVRQELAQQPAVPPLAYSAIWRFHSPLAMTTLMRMVSGPLISTGLAAMTHPKLSLAAWPVVFSILGLVSFAQSLQQTALALSHDPQSRAIVRNFILSVGLVSTVILTLAALTPLSRVVLRGFFGLPADIETIANLGLRAVLLVPLAICVQSLLRGMLIRQAQTATVRTGMAMNLGLLALMLFAGARYTDSTGVLVVGFALLVATLAEDTFLIWRHRELMKVV